MTNTTRSGISIAAQSPEAALASLGSGRLGLPSAEARRRLAEFGRNEAAAVARTPLWLTLLQEFSHFFALILWLAAGLAFTAEYFEPGDIRLRAVAGLCHSLKFVDGQAVGDPIEIALVDSPGNCPTSAGAPETVLPCCTTWLDVLHSRPLDDDARERFRRAHARFARDRVRACHRRTEDADRAGAAEEGRDRRGRRRRRERCAGPEDGRHRHRHGPLRYRRTSRARPPTSCCSTTTSRPSSARSRKAAPSMRTSASS